MGNESTETHSPTLPKQRSPPEPLRLYRPTDARTESSISRFRRRDDGILDVRAINPGVKRTQQAIREDLEIMLELSTGTPRPTLWQPIVTHERIPAEAFQAFLAGMSRVVRALAVLVDESTDKVLGGFPDAVGALMLPVRMFSDEDEALERLAVYN